MPSDENLMKQMDTAAVQAQAEFQQNIDKWSVKDLIEWWARWYLKAGHKRLGRILISAGKKKQKTIGQEEGNYF